MNNNNETILTSNALNINMPASSISQQNTSQINRLLRVILVNSYPQGYLHILDVDENTILSGHNGSGKTTLMGAVAPFYGMAPSAVTRKSESKKSFVDFYLPSENSYIIYEYMRDGQLLSVVLRSNPAQGLTARTAIFNFINTGYQESYFLQKQGDEKFFNRFSEVRRLIKEDGKFISNNLNQAEYEAIISNCPNNNLVVSSNASRQSIRQLRPDFSLTSNQRETFFGFAPIVKNVLESKLEFEQICQFLVQAMNNKKMLSHNELALVGVDMDTAKWVRMRKVWQKIETLKHKFSQLADTISDNHNQQKILARSLISSQGLHTQLESNLIDEKDHKATIDTTFIQKKSERRDNETNWIDTKKRLDNEIKRTSDTINHLETCKNNFENGNSEYLPLHTLKAMSASIATLEKQQSLEKEKHAEIDEQLKGKKFEIDKINHNFEQEKNKLTEIKNDNIKRLTQQENDIKHDLSKIKEQINAQYYADKERLTQQYQQWIEQYQRDEHQLNIEVATLTAEQKNVGFSEAYQQQITATENKVKEQRQQLKQQQTTLKNQENELKSIKDDIDHQLKRKNSEQQQVDTYQLQIDKLSSLSKGDTLYSFLLASEEQQLMTPTVIENIAKTINPELLKRNDLNVAWLDKESAEVNDSIFGLSLNTDYLQAPNEWLSKAEIANKIFEYERAIQTQQDTIDSIDSELKKLKAQYDSKGNEIKLCQSKISTLDGQIESDEKKVEHLKPEAKNEQQQRQAELGKKIAELNADITNKQQQTTQLNAEKEQKLNQLDSNKKQQLTHHEQDTESKRQELLKQVQMAEEQYTNAIKTVEIERDNAIQNQGYDPTVLNEIEEKLRQLAIDITNAERAKRRVEDYDFFIDGEYQQIYQLIADKTNSENKRQQLQQDYQRQQNTLSREIEKLQVQQQALTEKITKIEQGIERLSSLNNKAQSTLNTALVDMKTLEQEWLDNTCHDDELLSSSLSANALTQLEITRAELTDQVKKAEQIIQKGIELVNQVKKPFAEHSSMFEELFAKHIDPRVTEENWYLQANALQGYIQNEHETKKELIVHHYTLEAEKISNFKSELDEAHRNLNRFTKAINQQCADICTHLKALIIEKFQLQIKSRIKDNQWYGTLESFVNDFNDWRHQEKYSNPMPSDSLLNSFDKVHKEIGQSKFNVKFSKQFSMDITAKEYGKPEKHLTRTTSFADLSSHGTVRIAQLIIYISLLSTINTAHNVQLKLFIDEIGVLDGNNTKELLELLASQHISAMCAAPENLNEKVIPLFTNNIACACDKKGIYHLAQTDDMHSLTSTAKMQQYGIFDLDDTI